MFLPDVNVLMAAFRSDHPDHAKCLAWLMAAYANESQVGISPQTLSSVIRITTQAKFMGGHASRLEDVLKFSTQLITHSKTAILHPGTQHWDLFAKLCRASKAAGKLVPDAWFAALAQEHRCTWITLDSDFKKFPRLRWQLL